MKNAVFFSRAKKDVHSPRLLALLGNTPLRHEFCYYCVDPNPVTKKRNEDLLSLLDVTKVPTMYVNGEKYVGEEAFVWLQGKMRQLQGAGYREEFSGGAFPPGRDEPMYIGTEGGYSESGFQGGGGGGFQAGGFQGGRPQMVPPPGMLPGVGHVPQVGGFGSNVNPAGQSPMPGNGQDTGLQGNAMDCSFAEPFAPTDITGINSTALDRNQLSRLLTPVNTKNEDGTARSDALLEKYIMMREQQVPTPQTPGGQGIPGMGGMQMNQMAIPQMQMPR
jgi:hypothetical protein